MDAPGVLIICYYFPPNNGVGGRRWVKFSKQLAIRGYRVTVITSEIYTSDKDSFWEKDMHPAVKVVRVNDRYPKVLLRPVKTLFDKILYRLALTRLRSKVKGNIYDPSTLMEPVFNDDIIPLIKKENISNVIVSGAPFAYLYYSLKIKTAVPSVNLIFDYRDLWTDSRYSFGGIVKKHQGERRFMIEKEREELALRGCDKVIAVTEDIARLLSAHGKSVEEKIILITNGYDEDEGISAVSTDAATAYPANKETIIIYYLGTINCGRQYYMHFINALHKLRSEHLHLYRKLRIVFWGNNNINFARDLSDSGLECITQEGSITLTEMMSKLDTVDFLLYFKKEDELVNSFATKFYDYLRFRKPILLLSPPGAVADYVQQKNIGVLLNVTGMEKQLADLFASYLSNGIPFDHHLDFSEHSIQKLADKLLSVLSEPLKVNSN